MTIDYNSPGTVEERLQRLERKLSVEVTLWRVTGVVAIIMGMMLFTAGLWALGRAGMF